jgi:hypothetical protein
MRSDSRDGSWPWFTAGSWGREGKSERRDSRRQN